MEDAHPAADCATADHSGGSRVSLVVLFSSRCGCFSSVFLLRCCCLVFFYTIFAVFSRNEACAKLCAEILTVSVLGNTRRSFAQLLVLL